MASLNKSSSWALLSLAAIVFGWLSLTVVKIPKLLATDLFNDVPPLHENFEAIAYVREKGIVSGYPDSTFRPANTINRAEFTKIIIESVMPGEANGKDCFKDVKDEWFSKYVCYAQKKDIISGYPDGYFRPEKPIAFSEAAKIIVKTFRQIAPPPDGVTATPDDVWYKQPIEELGLLGAIPVGIDTFGKPINRGEMAEIMYRLKAQVKDKESLNFENLKIIDGVMNGIWDEEPKEKWHKQFLDMISLEPPDNFTYTSSDSDVDPPPYVPVDDPTIAGRFVPPSLPDIKGNIYNLPYPMDWDEQGQPSKGIYTLENSSKSFFDGDKKALEILEGRAVYDITSYGVCNTGADPFVTVVKDDFGEKIFNALAQLGYFHSISCGADLYDSLHLFQKKHDLPKSRIIDQATMKTLDEELKKIQQRDYEAAENFVCSQYLVDAPFNGRSKNHLAFLYSLALSAFPQELQIENTARGCFEGQTFQVSTKKRAICDGSYWTAYTKDCETRDNRPYLLPIDDFEIVSTILHEHAHTLHMGSLKWGTIDPKSFYGISYDLKSKIYTDQLYFKPKFNWEDRDVQRDNLCAWYGLGWSAGSEYPGYFTAYEDFAECVRMYITNGIPFRDAIKSKPVLKEKYEWLKKNVFEGREFASGDPNYLSYVDDFFDLSPAEMTVRRPDYVWDYNFHPMEGQQPLDARNISDRTDDNDKEQIHLMYIIPADGTDQKLDVNGTIESSVRILQDWLKPRSFDRSLRFDKKDGVLDISFLQLKKTAEEIVNSKQSLMEIIEEELISSGFDDDNKIYAVYYGGKSSVCSDSAWPPEKPGKVAVVYLNGNLNSESCGYSETFSKRRYEIGYYEYRMLREILHAMGFVTKCYKYSEKDGFVGNPQDIMYSGSGKWDPQNINSSLYDYLLNLGEQDKNCQLLPGDGFLDDKVEEFVVNEVLH